MNNKFVKELYEELPKLEEKGVVSRATAKKIKKHYGSPKEQGGLNTIMLVFGIIGAVLVGLGVILLFAHNWENLSRLQKTLISFLPLIVAQGLVFFGIKKKKDSNVWRESVGSFLFISIAATVGLISQVYNIPGDLSKFLVTWMVLGLPVIYFLNSTMCGMLFMWVLLQWTGHSQARGADGFLFWVFLGLFFPFFYKHLQKNKFSFRSIALGWAFSLCLIIGTGVSLEKNVPGLWMIVFSSLFVLLYFIGDTYFDKTQSVLRRPIYFAGSVGITLVSFLLTFDWPWERIGYKHYRTSWGYNAIPGIVDYVLSIGLPIVVFFYLMKLVKKDKHYLLFGQVPFFVIMFYLLQSYLASDGFLWFYQLFFNLYILYVSVNLILHGTKKLDIASMNGGMVLLSMLILARFFDVDLSFVTRGIVFILLGCCFLYANIRLMKKRGSHE